MEHLSLEMLSKHILMQNILAGHTGHTLTDDAVHTQRTLMVNLRLRVRCRIHPPPPRPPAALVLLCIVCNLYKGLRYLMYPMGDCIVRPVVKRWYAVGIGHMTCLKPYNSEHQKRLHSKF